MIQRGLLSVALAVLALFLTFASAQTPRPAAAGIGLRAQDLDGSIRALGRCATRPAVVVFLGTECPISRRYMPVLNDLAASAAAKNVELLGVISDPSVTRAAANDFRKQFAAAFPILFDASGEIGVALRPMVTPQAFVIDSAGAVVYSGRIDDQYVSVARQRELVTHRELADAIDAVSAGRAVAVDSAPPVGCAFEGWDKPQAAAKTTYARQIAPILYANCASCHHAGEVAPFPLTRYQDAAKRAKQIAAVTGNRFMPPWKAEENFGHFQNERRLTDSEIAAISDWAEAGAPEGDVADLPPAPQFASGWKLGTPDLVLTMPEAFSIPASGPDIYRAFVLPTNIPADTYVAGVQFLPGAPSVVHHSLLFLDSTGQGRKLQAASPDSPGYKTFGGIGFSPSGGLGGWAPDEPFMLPDGIGRPLPKTADVVMQIHYHPDGRPHRDQSRVAIYFAHSKINHIVGSIAMGTRRIDIAPGDSHYVINKYLTLPEDVTLVGATPHMHLLGRQMTVDATMPDGQKVPLISVDDWDFRWQDQYRYAQAVHLPKGARLHLEAVYDNSTENPANPNDPPKRVTHGEQTTDEMCVCFLSVLADNPRELRRLIVETELALLRP